MKEGDVPKTAGRIMFPGGGLVNQQIVAVATGLVL